MYTWGRGLYGVLGNGTNNYSLTPVMNEVIEGVKEETEPHGKITKLDSADEATGILMDNGYLNVWGKNDQGQLGVNNEFGMDMIESENAPV